MVYNRNIKVYISKRYLNVQGIQKVPKGQKYRKVAHRFKVSKIYLKVQAIEKVPKVQGI